jgi:hypothetical protein
LHEVNVCILNETQNIDLNREKENRNQEQRKKKNCSIRLERNQTKLLRNTEHAYRNFKRGTEIPERILRPFAGPLLDWNIFLSPPTRKHLIFQTISVCGRYRCQKKLHIAFNEVTCTKIQIAAVREGVNRNYSPAFCLEKRDLNSGVCSDLFS